jgi:hypothetical protein
VCGTGHCDDRTLLPSYRLELTIPAPAKTPKMVKMLSTLPAAAFSRHETWASAL